MPKNPFKRIREIFFPKKGFAPAGGFTLVEVLISLTIFSFAIGIVSQTFVMAVRLERKFLASTESLNEISYLMEYMARSIRMAKKDTGNLCLVGSKMNYEKTYSGSGIKFLTQNGQCREFYLSGTTIYENKDNGAQVNALTSPKIRVTAFNIGPSDSWDQDDQDQPRVVIFIELSASDNSAMKMQTTISQRNPDIKK